MAYLDYNGLSRFKDKVFQALLSKFSNPNLLINSNFEINQRGASSYTSSNVYTVDRWKKGSGTVTVSSDHITLSVGCSISQYFEATPFADQTLTATINVNGTLVSKSFTFVSTNSNTVIQLFANGWRLEYSGGSKYFRIVNVSGSASDKLYWAKLEIGDVSTIYNPPVIAEELPKCQRYFYRINDGEMVGVGQSFSSTQINILGTYPVKMRTIPTMTISSNNGVYLYNAGTFFDTISGYTRSNGNYMYELVLSVSSITSGVVLQCWLSGAYIDCDAEIY